MSSILLDYKFSSISVALLKNARWVGFEPTWSLELAGFGDQYNRPLCDHRIS